MKKLILGLVVGLLLGSAMTALASNEKVLATFRNDFKLVIGDKPAKLEQAPLVYDGKSYLPVREIAGLLGHDVGFEQDTIILNKKEVDEVIQEIDLDEWISYKDLAVKNNAFAGQITTGSLFSLVLPDLRVLFSFDAAELNENGELVVDSLDGKKIRLIQYNGRTFINKSDIKSVDESIVTE